MLQKTAHILVIRLSAMGDVAISAPVLRAFTAQHPTVKITVLSTPFFEPFFEDIPNIYFYKIDKKGKHKGILGLYKLANELAKLNIDAIADLHNVLRSKILVRLLQFKGITNQQIDKGRADKKALTRIKNKVFKPLKSSAERYADVFRVLGFPIHLKNIKLPNHLILSEKITQSIGETKNKKIGIAPFAAHEGKMYPLVQMQKVIEKLAKTHQVLLFGGGEKEAKQLTEIAQTNKNIISVANQFTFKEELALISNLDIMVAMDSGNGHLAAMYGIPVITIWGVTHPYAGFTPFNQPQENQILPNLEQFPLLPTSIYGNKYPEGYLSCFDTITPKMIISTVEAVLD